MKEQLIALAITLIIILSVAAVINYFIDKSTQRDRRSRLSPTLRKFFLEEEENDS